MPVFAEIADQWQIADSTFSTLEQQAFVTDNDLAFDTAGEQRRRNDQAYFLYLFTRFEDAVNQAVAAIVANRVTGTAWPDRRVWQAWARGKIEDIHFMSKVEILTDKSLAPYATIKNYYDGRNEVAHGGVWSEQFFVPAIAQTMEVFCQGFPAD